MGNCTSKKSGKALKLNLPKKPILKKMDKDQEAVSKGLSKKVAPFTKGEATSFGFKKKPTSALPIPVTLTSNGHAFPDNEEKNKVQNGILKNKDLIDDYQSGSSVESLCHAPLRSTPKMIRKKDLARQNLNSTFGNNINNNNNVGNINNNNNNTATTVITTTIVNNNNTITHYNNSNNNNNVTGQPTNRFGFRQQAQKSSEVTAKTVKYAANTHVAGSYALSNQGPYDTGTYKVNKKPESSTRSRSEGPREAFFKQTLQPAGSMQSVLNQPRAANPAIPQPGKFTLQTSHLPRPQFPVRMPDTKTAKTVTNYYRRGGAQSDSNSSKEGSLNEDSGFESHPSANNSLARGVHTLDSSPGYGVRKRLATANGKKLEMKIVGNKFELLKKDEENDPTVVTEVSLIKLPSSGIRTSTAIINTGLVEQRTNQYLKRIQSTGKDASNKFVKDSTTGSDNSQVDEGLGGESEEEKLFKDSKKSEKSSGGYFMSHGNEDGDEMLPGEAMAEDISLSLSSDEESSSQLVKKPSPRPAMNLQTDVTPNSIRLDALKLSKQLKCKIQSISDDSVTNIELKIEDSSLGPLTSCEPDEETFPSDSILEQLSSDSDSLGDKGENKDNDKEKNLKNADIDVETEDLEIDVDVDVDIEDDKDLTDVKTEDIEELELNIEEEKEFNDVNNDSREPHTPPESPGTPTNASNSLSLSEGRDFLIDDEIADQPQLCFTETYPDCSCQEDVKTCNDKTLTSSGGNNDFLSCTENTKVADEEAQDIMQNDENGPVAGEEVAQTPSPGKVERRRNSVGTLSPCESLTSDDLMMDFESSVCDESAERADSVNDNCSMIDIEISTNGEEILKEWSSVSSQRSSGMGSGKLLKSRGGSGSGSSPGSPRSLDMVSRGVSSPMRSSRPSTADEDSVKIDKISYQHMFQDIVSIKTMLLKLKRVLSESEGNLYENGIKLYQDDKALENGATDELSDLRRQVTFLQQQLEERERMVQNLQLEINKNSEGCKTNGFNELREQCNAATQTDRVRPVSTGPSILQNLPSDSGSLVSFRMTKPQPE